MKWQVGEMISWSNEKLLKWQLNQMTNCWNDENASI